MNQKKVKYIRRIMRQDYPERQSDIRYISHPKILDLVNGDKMARYSFQYITTGFKKVVKAAKMLYKKHGLLPR